ncbi:hypothetical protein [Azospirillum sp.]|uniref:hypothetical protein n=1 Tax=Azospirillum sp. TaxID=34012 RepID=UPI003D75BD6A
MAAQPKEAKGAQATVKNAKGIRIRMYRLGIGDCFLLTLPRSDGTPFHMLIDCGIHMSETNGAGRIRTAVQDILAATGGTLDVVVGTHEHWDHLSGFYHAADLFKAGCARSIWCAWTEDQRDAFAKSLQKNRDEGVAALWGAVRRLHMAEAYGDQTAAHESPRSWDGVLGFFGDSPGVGVKAKAAADAMRALVASGSDIVYRSPGEAPFDEISLEWRFFVLAPPRDKGLLKHADPRAGSAEAYPLAADLHAVQLGVVNLAGAVSDDDDPPFAPRFQIPLESTRSLPFFQEHYWMDQAAGDIDADPDGDGAQEDSTQDWRRIGNSWLDGAETLALQLDKITNNTSLVLALEIGPKEAKGNPVVLFAADAQVGNWLSWKTVEWPDYAGRSVSGPDLLRRTVVYKVGHHASQNATLMEGGLEAMTNLRLALIPTSAEMAGKVKWGTLPWQTLLDRLTMVTSDRVLRSDTGPSANALATPGVTVEADPKGTYFDITLPLDLKVKP